MGLLKESLADLKQLATTGGAAPGSGGTLKNEINQSFLPIGPTRFEVSHQYQQMPKPFPWGGSPLLKRSGHALRLLRIFADNYTALISH